MHTKRLLISLLLGAGLALGVLALIAARLVLAAPMADQVVTNTNDSGAGSLRQAIADVHDGGSITFNIGGGYPATITLTSGELSVNKSITITGPGTDQLFVSGNDASRVFNINGADVTLADLTVTRGNIAGNGGGMYVSNGTVTLSGAQVVSNTATSYGGGVYIQTSGFLTQTSGSIERNWANYGGGICAYGDAVLSGGQIVSNTASGSAGAGGGMYIYGNVALSGVEIRGNSAENGGGMYTIINSEVTLSGGQIVSNTSVWNGGGVYVSSNSAFTQTAGSIALNRADYAGGGVYVYYNANFVLTGGEIISNTASQWGGGVSLYSDLTLSGGKIAGNAAGTTGGVYVNTAGTFTQTAGSITNNSATSSAGGVYVQGKARLNGGEIRGNTTAGKETPPT
jgi:hypothetical protein